MAFILIAASPHASVLAEGGVLFVFHFRFIVRSFCQYFRIKKNKHTGSSDSLR